MFGREKERKRERERERERKKKRERKRIREVRPKQNIYLISIHRKVLRIPASENNKR